jgi:hypothetical protein
VSNIFGSHPTNLIRVEASVGTPNKNAPRRPEAIYNFGAKLQGVIEAFVRSEFGDDWETIHCDVEIGSIPPESVRYLLQESRKAGARNWEKNP